jgi:hypothetical protein
MQNFFQQPIRVKIPRSLVIGIMLMIFTLGYIITPYWVLVNNPWMALLIVTIVSSTGAAWAYVSSAQLRLDIRPGGMLLFAINLLLLFGLNYRTLFSAISWRGDESFHISRSMILYNLINPYWLAVGVCLGLLFLFLCLKAPRWAAILFITVVLILVTVYLSYPVFKNFIKSPLIFLRYPFISYWAGAVLLRILGSFSDVHQEIYFRIIPFLAATLLVTQASRKYLSTQPMITLLAGVAFASIPLLYYYESIYYLEMPALFLMLVACMQLEELLQAPLDQLRQNPAWYALILVGFIKETALPFLAAVLLLRLVMTLWRAWHQHFGRQAQDGTTQVSPWQLVRQELLIAFSVLFPNILYLALHIISPLGRGFSLQLANIWQPVTYQALGNAFRQQYGPLLLLFLVGILLLVRNKKTFLALALTGLFLLYPVFHSLDTPHYIGYSRFNLFNLAPMLVGATVVLDHLLGEGSRFLRQRKLMTGVLLASIILINLWMSPINADGTKQPMWGNYVFDTSEHYYPYPEVLTWLKTRNMKGTILFAGRTYPYPVGFYFAKIGWKTGFELTKTPPLNDETGDLAQSLHYAEKKNHKIVVYQLKGFQVPDLPLKKFSFKHRKVFCNLAHCLLVIH